MKELHPGDQVCWRGLNRYYTGTVMRLTPAGWLVLVDGSEKHIIISNLQNYGKK